MFKGLWHDIRAILRKYRKGFWAVIAAAVVVGLVFVGTMATISEKPEFCRSCHIMEPYYQSWKHSNHVGVNCLLCHFKPGWRGFVRGKIVALSQFVRYVTVTYGSRPWAEIEDDSCLRSGCHDRQGLFGPKEFQKGVPFDHEHHLTALKRGKQLRCTSCHSQIVQGTHMMVTESVCFICHFKPMPDGSRDPVLSDCRKCHRRGMATPRTPAEHALFIERGTDCQRCHISAMRGAGDVARRRCEFCHADPKVLATSDTTVLHTVHVSEHTVACFKCHDPILHQLETSAEITQAGCGNCHTERHQAQKAFYQGAASVPFAGALPSPMIEAHIDCTACHANLGAIATTSPLTAKPAVARADTKVCNECHGPGYDLLLGQWQTEVARRVGQTRVMTRVAAVIPEDAASTPVAALARAVNETLDIIGIAKAVHNVGYTETLIEHCQATLLEATSATAAGPALRDWVDDEMKSYQQAPSCLQQCHYGISQRTLFLQNQNRLFPHAPHVNRARLDCGTCHSREQHKVSLPRGYDCNACHHRDAAGKQCEDCHQELIEFVKGNYAGYGVASPASRNCDACHADVGGKITLLNRSTCTQCHADAQAYLNKLAQQMEDLKRRGPEIETALRARWDTLDLKGLQIAEQVRHVGRMNGIHNYELAKRIYEAAGRYLSKSL